MSLVADNQELSFDYSDFTNPLSFHGFPSDPFRDGLESSFHGFEPDSDPVWSCPEEFSFLGFESPEKRKVTRFYNLSQIMEESFSSDDSGQPEPPVTLSNSLPQGRYNLRSRGLATIFPHVNDTPLEYQKK